MLGQATSDFGLTRLTTARIWGTPSPSPIQYTLHFSAKATSKWLFVLGLPKGNPETAKARTPATLWGYNFVLRPPIETSSCQELSNGVLDTT